MFSLIRPKFWQQKNWISLSLLPLSYIYHAITYLRYILSHPQSVGIPVICVGNITVGGTGKTPTVMAIARFFLNEGKKVAIISRGFRGHLSHKQKAVRVEGHHSAYEVGDEALLLSKTAPTYICKNRFIAALAAKKDGAEVIIMDDGIQHYSLHKDLSILLIDTLYGFGNKFLLPAGPMRESSNMLDKIDCILYTGGGIFEDLSTSKIPQFVMTPHIIDRERFSGKSFISLCAIASPERFVATLRSLNINIIEQFTFADHHYYSQAEIEHITYLAAKRNTKIITTSKDICKIPKHLHDNIEVLDMEYILPQGLLKLIQRTTSNTCIAEKGQLNS